VSPKRAVPEDLADLPYAAALREHRGGLDVEGDYDTVHLHGVLAEAGTRAAGARFLEAALTDCVFDGVDLRGARFNDVWASGCRLTACSLAGGQWLDTAVVGSSLAGVELYDAVLRRVTFVRCKLDSVNLRATALHDVVFEDCVLRDVDFGEARLKGVAFPGSRIERATFGRSVLADTDLRGAVAIDLADGYESLRGAVVTPVQLLDLAPMLAQALGLTVAEPEARVASGASGARRPR
jgi:uncharacterized protein YjbI with pentapeptide repeats